MDHCYASFLLKSTSIYNKVPASMAVAAFHMFLCMNCILLLFSSKCFFKNFHCDFFGNMDHLVICFEMRWVNEIHMLRNQIDSRSSLCSLPEWITWSSKGSIRRQRCYIPSIERYERKLHSGFKLLMNKNLYQWA